MGAGRCRGLIHLLLISLTIIAVVHLTVNSSCSNHEKRFDQYNRLLEDRNSDIVSYMEEIKKSKSKLKELEQDNLELARKLKSCTEELQQTQNQLTLSNVPEESWIPDSEHKLAVVVPFRDRFDELLHFVPIMTKFLTNQLGKNSFEIFIINQADNNRFNRAALINVGYIVGLEHNCDYMVMHDVDLLPNNDGLNYRFPGESSKYVHLASPEYHPKYHYAEYIGGVLLLTMNNFDRMNGMSNNYWGWGREDDEFRARLAGANMVRERPQGLKTGYKTFLHIHDKEHRKRDYTVTPEQKAAQSVSTKQKNGQFKLQKS